MFRPIREDLNSESMLARECLIWNTSTVSAGCTDLCTAAKVSIDWVRRRITANPVEYDSFR
jgi:hypothetical protein